jgi:hypothetical protein
MNRLIAAAMLVVAVSNQAFATQLYNYDSGGASFLGSGGAYFGNVQITSFTAQAFTGFTVIPAAGIHVDITDNSFSIDSFNAVLADTPPLTSTGFVKLSNSTFSSFDANTVSTFEAGASVTSTDGGSEPIHGTLGSSVPVTVGVSLLLGFSDDSGNLLYSYSFANPPASLEGTLTVTPDEVFLSIPTQTLPPVPLVTNAGLPITLKNDTFSFGGSATFTVAPEPSSILVAVLGITGLLAYRWRR